MRAAGLPVDALELRPILEQFLEYYTAHAADKTTWMPGALEALDALSSCPLAICTNKPKVTTLAVLNAFGVVDRFAQKVVVRFVLKHRYSGLFVGGFCCKFQGGPDRT